LPWPRLEVLIRHLPRDSAYVRAISPEWADWGRQNYQLAEIVDALNAANWQRSHSKENPVPRPEPSWRPEMVPVLRAKQERKQSMAERLLAQAQRVIESRRKT
jgi:hypothetical protein